MAKPLAVVFIKQGLKNTEAVAQKCFVTLVKKRQAFSCEFGNIFKIIFLIELIIGAIGEVI